MFVCCECCVLCVVRWNSLRRADHPSRGVLPTVMCPAECDLQTSTIRRLWPTRVVEPWKKILYRRCEYKSAGLKRNIGLSSQFQLSSLNQPIIILVKYKLLHTEYFLFLSSIACLRY